MKLKTIYESIVSKIPSLQDLASAIQLFQIGKSSVIYPSGGGYVVIRPIQSHNPTIDINKYNKIIKAAIENDDYTMVIDGLKEMGFEISGKIDHTKIGKTTDPKLEQEAEQTGTKIPRSGTRERGGISATRLNKIQTPYDYVEGKPDSVEIKVEYDPEDTEEDGFVFHTHPEEPEGGFDPKDTLKYTDKTRIKKKPTNNNYFPGKEQKR